MDDEIFVYLSINEFKEACKNILTDLQIILITRPKTVTDEHEKLALMSQFHDNPIFGGHTGQKKLYAKLRNNYYWRNMTRDIARFVRNCEICQLTKVKPKTREPMVLTPTPQKPFDTVVIDTIGPLTQSCQGNRYAVTMICDLTKYLVVAPVPTKEASVVAKAILTEFILKYGLMKKILTDLGTEYVNQVLTQLCNLLKITHATSTGYHHQTVGAIERNHRTFNEYLRSYIEDKLGDWENYIQYFAFCYNISNNSSINHKYTPYELVFSKKPVLPNDFLCGRVDPIYNFEDFTKEAKYRLQNAHIEAINLIGKLKLRNKAYYDKITNPIDIKENEKVLVKKEPYDKHNPIYAGPFVVQEVQGSNAKIFNEKTNKTKIIHKDRLIKYIINK